MSTYYPRKYRSTTTGKVFEGFIVEDHLLCHVAISERANKNQETQRVLIPAFSPTIIVKTPQSIEELNIGDVILTDSDDTIMTLKYSIFQDNYELAD